MNGTQDESELINALVAAMQRDNAARQAAETAASEERDAAHALSDAWAALRAHQDARVKLAFKGAE